MSDTENVVDSDTNEMGSQRKLDESNIPVSEVRTGLGAANEVRMDALFRLLTRSIAKMDELTNEVNSFEAFQDYLILVHK